VPSPPLTHFISTLLLLTTLHTVNEQVKGTIAEGLLFVCSVAVIQCNSDTVCTVLYAWTQTWTRRPHAPLLPPGVPPLRRWIAPPVPAAAPASACTVHYFTVHYCTVLYCSVLYYTVLYCTYLGLKPSCPRLPPGRLPLFANGLRCQPLPQLPSQCVRGLDGARPKVPTRLPQMPGARPDGRKGVPNEYETTNPLRFKWQDWWCGCEGVGDGVGGAVYSTDLLPQRAEEKELYCYHLERGDWEVLTWRASQRGRRWPGAWRGAAGAWLPLPGGAAGAWTHSSPCALCTTQGKDIAYSDTLGTRITMWRSLASGYLTMKGTYPLSLGGAKAGVCVGGALSKIQRAGA